MQEFQTGGWAAFAANAVVAGILATFALDLWQRLLFAVAGIPPANWGLVGRWFAHMPRGRFLHDAIAEAAPVEHEVALGWAMHYLIGVVYGFAYLGLIVLVLGSTPSPLNGFVFGAASVVVPWFIMQPALGLGVMGAKAPVPAIPRYGALAGHCLYGVALFAGSALHGAVQG